MVHFVTLDLIQDNLMSPMVLAFFLGLASVRFKSDLKFPDDVYAMLSYYLLLALGLKGGAALRDTSFQQVVFPSLAALLLGCLLPLIAYYVARLVRFQRIDAAALSAHYGSVSVVTFMASLVFVEKVNQPAMGYMTALVAILEIPGIVMALLLAQKKSSTTLQDNSSNSIPFYYLFFKRIQKILASKSILLLIGGLGIGFLSGPKGIEPIAPFFVHPFKGILVLFLLDMGILAGQCLEETKSVGRSVIFYALFIPLVNACVAIAVGHFIGMDLSSTTTFAAMASSASYIAAPAAVRLSLPDANPGIYLTASIVITFPFNLVFGIPLYYFLTQVYFS